MRGCVYLVGAGCGRADLITLRGLRLLQCCDVVVYDDLIDRHLLEAAPQAAERLYVGKRLGRHSTPQEEISRLLVKKTLEGSEGVTEAVISHEKGTAVVTLEKEVADSVLKEAVEAQDYKVVSVQ